ncbi:hypothetical protein [Stigmatella aurantiaca]|nr:hypothetical protein [Stigmatella aurantiaca]
MTYEDVIGLVAYSSKEAEELEKKSAAGQGSGAKPSGQGTTRRLRKR